MIQTIEEHFETKSSPETHERLLMRTQEMHIKPNETHEDYIARHVVLRSDMLRASYLSIENELVTVTFIIKGLRARTNLASIVPTLMIQRPPTIKDLKTTLALLASIQMINTASDSQDSPQYSMGK